MKKKDAVISAIIGFLIGIFFFIFLGNILKEQGIKIPYLWILIIIFPLLSLLGIFIVSWLGKRFLIIFQAGKFALVGALNFFIDLGILSVLMLAAGITSGLFYSIFKGASFLIATINSYFWNKHWTFEKRERVFASKEFSKFLVMVSIGALLNVGIASLVVNIIGPQFGISEFLWGIVGALTATLFAWIWNFFGAKFVVFKK